MSNLASSGILINGKIWSTCNLDVSTFRNGDPIPEAETEEKWFKVGKYEQPAWCWASNDPEEREKYGKLYNHFAVTDPRGLAPQGWRIPTEDELESLIVDGQLTDVINLPMAGGCFLFGGLLGNAGSVGYYWSSSVDGEYARLLGFKSGDASILSYDREDGYSVRCLKD